MSGQQGNMPFSSSILNNCEAPKLPPEIWDYIFQFSTVDEVMNLRKVGSTYAAAVKTYLPVLIKRFSSCWITFRTISSFSEFVNTVDFSPISSFKFDFPINEYSLLPNVNKFVHKFCEQVYRLSLCTLSVPLSESDAMLFSKFVSLSDLTIFKVIPSRYEVKKASNKSCFPHVRRIRIQENIAESRSAEIQNYLTKIHKITYHMIDDPHRSLVSANSIKNNGFLKAINFSSQLLCTVEEMHLDLSNINKIGTISHDCMHNFVHRFSDEKTYITGIPADLCSKLLSNPDTSAIINARNKFFENVKTLHGYSSRITHARLPNIEEIWGSIDNSNILSLTGALGNESTYSWTKLKKINLQISNGLASRLCNPYHRHQFPLDALVVLERFLRHIFSIQRPSLQDLIFTMDATCHLYFGPHSLVSNFRNLVRLTLDVASYSSADHILIFGILAEFNTLECLNLTMRWPTYDCTFTGRNFGSPVLSRITSLRHFTLTIIGPDESRWQGLITDRFFTEVISEMSLTCFHLKNTRYRSIRVSALGLQSLLDGNIGRNIRQFVLTGINMHGFEEIYNQIKNLAEKNCSLLPLYFKRRDKDCTNCT